MNIYHPFQFRFVIPASSSKYPTMQLFFFISIVNIRVKKIGTVYTNIYKHEKNMKKYGSTCSALYHFNV